MTDRGPALLDPVRETIPDLVLGLFGVPVAFAVQNIAQKTVDQQINLWVGVIYILLFMTLYAVYVLSLVVLLEHTRRRAIWTVLLILGGITSVAVILAGAYYPRAGQTQIASAVGMLTPTLTFGFVVMDQPRMSQRRQPLTDVLLGFYGALVILLCLIIYDVIP